MADEEDGRGKRRKLNHIGSVLNSPPQYTARADLSRTGHTYPSISIDGAGQSHLGDIITINKIVDCEHTSEQKEQAKRDKALIESLTFERIDARRANIASALPETCEWVFTHPHFVAWESHSQAVDHGSFLWLKGKPGCGKSTIMKLVCARASKIFTNHIILTYFFNARAPGLLEKSSFGLYRSLTHQLLTALPQSQYIFLTKFRSKMRQVKGGESKVEEWTAAELKDFLVAVIIESDPPPITILIDALDEGDESDVRDMVTFFEGLRHHAYARALDIVVEQQNGHDTDIFRYIQLNLHGDQSPSMDELRRKVHQKSSGVFLWVILVVPMLNTAFDRGKSLGDASRRLEDIPKELDALLVDILARSDEDIDECICLLQWVTFAMESLTPRQLYVAILYSGTSSPAETVEILDNDRIERYLLHCSRGLVEVTRSSPPQIQFIHETIRTFLLGERGLVMMDARLEARLEGISHDRLKEACLRCVKRGEALLTTQYFTSGFRYEHSLHSKNNPLFTYAVPHLFAHADAAQRYGLLQLEFVTAISENRNDIFSKFKRCEFVVNPRYCITGVIPPTPLYRIAEQDLVDLAQCLIDYGVDVNAVTRYGSALYAASNRGHLRMVQLLLDHGADVNIRSRYGNHTALESALRQGYLQIVQLLLDHGADVNMRAGIHKRTALETVSYPCRSPVLVELLRKYGAK